VGINKNFVVKNGFEASTDLILADADTRKVGIGTTRPRYDFTVAGGIGATDFYLTGIGTFVNELNVGLGGTVLTVLGLGNSIGVGTAVPAYLLDIRSPVSTGQTALYVQGDVRITGDIVADDIIFDDARIDDLTITNTFLVEGLAGLSTFNSNVYINGNLNVSGVSTSEFINVNNLNVSGFTTFSNYVDINNSVDISNNLNVGGIATVSGQVNFLNNLNVVGIATIGSVSIVGATLSNLTVSGTAILGIASASQLNVNGIGTITNLNSTNANLTNISGTNLNYSGIGTIFRLNTTNGTITNLTGTAGTITNLNSTNANLTNISGTNLNYSGIGTINTFNVGTQASKATISYTTNAARTLTIPSLDGNRTFAFIDQNQTFNGTQTFNNLRATGISTFGSVQISSGIVTSSSSGIVTYYGDGRYLQNVISGVGINTAGGVVGTGATILDFRGAGISTVTVSAGIATINIESGVGIGSQTQIIKETFTVDDPQQSSFILSNSYTTNYIEVFLNGVRLSSADYIQTSPVSIFLINSAVEGDVVDVVNFKTTVVGFTSAIDSLNSFNINISSVNSIDETTSVVLVADQLLGNQKPFIDSGIIYNASRNLLTVGGISTTSGTSNQFLKADGSVDSTPYTSTGKAIAMAIVFGG